jgi:protein-tyrosine-phosphatase
MATAFAERERDQRGLDSGIITGGVDPTESVHEDVIEAMQETDIDISDRRPHEISPEDIEDLDHVLTIGCSID